MRRYKTKNNVTKHPFYPKLLKEFHLTKNGEMKLSDFGYGSPEKTWWKCDKADDHEWKAAIHSRFNGRGCPCCAGKKVVLSNCLQTTHPEDAKKWHQTKNGDITPYDVTAGSSKKRWFKCDVAYDHKWEARIADIINVYGCPFCSGQKVVLSNCFATTSKDTKELSEWDQEKNGDITPFDVTAGSNKKRHWKCDKADDHKWEATISDRTNGHGCPYCAGVKIVLSTCFATTHVNTKELSEWDYEKNGDITPYDVTAGSGEKRYWECDKGHKWKTSTCNRTNGSGCPECAYIKRYGITYEEFQKTLPERKIYRNKVIKITNRQPIHLLPNYEKRGLSGVPGAYHQDHRYSIDEGFKNNIDPEIIGHIANLEMITWQENGTKQNKCSITLEELLKKI